jgi:hypothetical protein
VERRPKNAPEPTDLHLDFIRASEDEAEARLSAQRKQLEAMAAAQREREKALHEAEEALKQAADAQRRRARIRNIALVGLVILVGLAASLFWRAEQQRQVAEEQRAVAEEQRKVAEEQRAASEEQRKLADNILEGATNIIVEFRDQMNINTQKEVFAVLKAGADHGNVKAMVGLGQLYRDGFGTAQDFAKAREWYGKAADKGDGASRNFLRWGLPIYEAAGAGHYAEALQLQEAWVAHRGAVPDEWTPIDLQNVAWRALFARDFTKALTVADRAHALLSEDSFTFLSNETNRAHALMFLGRGEEAKALYLAHKGKPLPGQHGRLWERAIALDFAEFRKAGLTHPMMADIEKELGVSP